LVSVTNDAITIADGSSPIGVGQTVGVTFVWKSGKRYQRCRCVTLEKASSSPYEWSIKSADQMAACEDMDEHCFKK